MSKVAVSISMDSELAQELKLEAQETGEKSFSALVCRLIAAGRMIDQPLIPTVEQAPTESFERQASATDRVRDHVSEHRRSILEVARLSDVSSEEASDIVAALIDDGEPIILRLIGGVLHCWTESSSWG